MQPGDNFDAFMKDMRRVYNKKNKEEEIIGIFEASEPQQGPKLNESDQQDLQNYKNSSAQIENKLSDYKHERDQLQKQQASKSNSRQREPQTQQFLENLSLSQTRKQKKLNQLQSEVQEQEDAECTFAPLISLKSQDLAEKMSHLPIFHRCFLLLTI